MKQILFFAFLLLQLTAFAQEDKINWIRQEYNRIATHITEGEKSSFSDANIGRHKLQLQTIVPAIGIQNTTVAFYYYSVDTCEGEYLDFLAKVVVTFSIAASSEFYIEYVYNKKEALIFSFLKANGMTCGEQRFYLSDNKLIKIKSNAGKNCLEDEFTEVFKDYERNNNFTLEDQKKFNEVLRKGNEYATIFHALIKCDNLEKSTSHISGDDMPRDQ